MTLKQTQEEELKKFDELYGSFELSKIVSKPEYEAHKQFLLSAMEASARGAIEATRIKWEPAHTYSSENADLYRGYDNGFKSAISDQATKAKDYLGDTHD